MFLRNSSNGDLIEVIDLQEMFDPFIKHVHARTQAGEDTMDIGNFNKSELVFPSGEPLPMCWRDSHYLEHCA